MSFITNSLKNNNCNKWLLARGGLLLGNVLRKFNGSLGFRDGYINWNTLSLLIYSIYFFHTDLSRISFLLDLLHSIDLFLYKLNSLVSFHHNFFFFLSLCFCSLATFTFPFEAKYILLSCSYIFILFSRFCHIYS